MKNKRTLKFGSIILCLTLILSSFIGCSSKPESIMTYFGSDIAGLEDITTETLAYTYDGKHTLDSAGDYEVTEQFVLPVIKDVEIERTETGFATEENGMRLEYSIVKNCENPVEEILDAKVEEVATFIFENDDKYRNPQVGTDTELNNGFVARTITYVYYELRDSLALGDLEKHIVKTTGYKPIGNGDDVLVFALTADATEYVIDENKTKSLPSQLAAALNLSDVKEEEKIEEDENIVDGTNTEDNYYKFFMLDGAQFLEAKNDEEIDYESLVEVGTITKKLTKDEIPQENGRSNHLKEGTKIFSVSEDVAETEAVYAEVDGELVRYRNKTLSDVKMMEEFLNGTGEVLDIEIDEGAEKTTEEDENGDKGTALE